MGSLTLQSKAFKENGAIPKKFGYKHGNASPPLIIDKIPDSAVSLVLIMDDPDAMGPAGKVWVHWVVWNIDPTNCCFDENSVPTGCIEGRTDFDEIGYGGPAPPDKEHTYLFKLYALDKKLNVRRGSTKKEIESAIKNHIIEETALRGRYTPVQ